MVLKINQKKKKKYKLPDKNFSVKVGDLKLGLSLSTSDNFMDDTKIYQKKKDITISDDKIQSFIKDMFFLTDMGKDHIFNFLSDLDSEDEVIKNCEIIHFLSYKKYFVLWSSPAISNKLLERKPGYFFVRTSTSVAGQYTFSFNKEGNLLHYRVTHENLKANLKIYRKQMKYINVNPIHTNATHYGYKTTF